jgi:hypothetical protein
MLFSKIKNFFDTQSINLLILFLSFLFFILTSFGSYFDVINPDSINWHTRSYNFIQAINSHHFSDTYQVYHPGITLMWLMGPTLYFDSNFYTKENFLDKDYLAKHVIYLVLTINFFFSLKLLTHFLKPATLSLFSVLYIFEPFFLGVRRLVHLEGLMVSFLFLSFLLLATYSLKKSKIIYLGFSIFTFVLALYTKSAAVVVLPIFLLFFLFSKNSIKAKFQHFLISITFGIAFLYILFPALWESPIKNSQLFFSKIYEGASLIGYEGRREVGTSGQGENLILSKSHSKVSYFYLDSILFTLSPIFWVFLISTLPLIVYLFYRYFYFNNLKKEVLKKIISNSNFKLIVFTLLCFLIYFVTYSLSTKSYERYSHIFFPFLVLYISLILNLIASKFSIISILIYLFFITYELYKIFPYYYSYGNSYLGGSYQRYEKLNSPPFGVGIFELNQKLNQYIKENEKEYYPVIAGSKSLKAIFNSGRNERYPMCDVDIFIQFYDDKSPKEVCVGRTHRFLFSINIGNIDYWKVYKFEKRSSKAKKLNETKNQYVNEDNREDQD